MYIGVRLIFYKLYMKRGIKMIYRTNERIKLRRKEIEIAKDIICKEINISKKRSYSNPEKPKRSISLAYKERRRSVSQPLSRPPELKLPPSLHGEEGKYESNKMIEIVKEEEIIKCREALSRLCEKLDFPFIESINRSVLSKKERNGRHYFPYLEIKAVDIKSLCEYIDKERDNIDESCKKDLEVFLKSICTVRSNIMTVQNVLKFAKETLDNLYAPPLPPRPKIPNGELNKKSYHKKEDKLNKKSYHKKEDKLKKKSHHKKKES